MAIVTPVSELWVLVIDDMEGMRSQLRMSLSSAGFAKLHVVSTVKEALERIAVNQYHVILCDYALGEGANGQQFLEYLRTHDVIKRNTIFFMITAEQAYEKVVAACECAPDDYLLKPFTAAQFNLRLEKLLARQKIFTAIDHAADNKNWRAVVSECDKLLADKDKYYFDLCKIKGAALMRNNRPEQAAELYREVLGMRPVAWAKLGLAKALVQLNKQAEAIAVVEEIVVESPQFLASYDFLSKLLAESGKPKDALALLQKAQEISPGTMSRIRNLSSLALTTGQPELAEAMMRATLQRHKYSPVREADDFVLLANALVDQGKAEEAIGVVKEAHKAYSDAHSQALLTANECLVYKAAGKLDLAQAALDQVLNQAQLGDLSAEVVMTMANACFALGREAQATQLLQHAVQNNHENEAVKNKVHSLLVATGKAPEEARALIDASTREVVLLNNEGVRKAQAGQLSEAIAMLSEAANRLPNNLQILGNAAYVIAFDLVRNGRSAEKLAQCLSYREALRKKSPDHVKLEQIDALLKQLKSNP